MTVCMQVVTFLILGSQPQPPTAHPHWCCSCAVSPCVCLLNANNKLTIWAFGSGSKIRYFSDLQGKNGDRDPELLSKNPQKSDFTLCDRVFRSNK